LYVILQFYKNKVLDIFNGDGWDKICKFLGKNISDQPFSPKNPRQNLAKNSNYLLNNQTPTEFNLLKKIRILGKKLRNN
jgi:hypothetical protein